MAAHTEVPVKVNCWVDRGIAPLVDVLNEFEDVWTLDSCENDRSELRRGAYVMFAYRGPNPDGFTAEIASLTRERVAGHLVVEWHAGDSEPVLTLSCMPEQVPDLSRALSLRMTR